MIPQRTRKSLKGLNDMCKYLESKHDVSAMTMLEIGSWTGKSALMFGQTFGNVICVDPWEATEEINTEYNMKEVEDLFDRNVSYIDNVTKIKSRFEDVKDIPRFDIAYIDGLHYYEACKADIERVKKEGCKIICGHDYWHGRFDGVIKAVNETVGKPDKVFDDTSWIKYL